jgi:hypothetical protein
MSNAKTAKKHAISVVFLRVVRFGMAPFMATIRSERKSYRLMEVALPTYCKELVHVHARCRLKTKVLHHTPSKSLRIVQMRLACDTQRNEIQV